MIYEENQMKIRYGVLLWDAERKLWKFDVSEAGDRVDRDLVKLLDFLGDNGWEAAAAGKFYEGERDQVIFKKIL